MRLDHRPLALPPIAIDVAEVAKAAEEYREFVAEHRTESDRLFGLEERRHEAVEADAEALGAAKRAGKPDPGATHVEAADKAIAETRRQVAGLAVAVATAGDDLVGAVEKARPTWAAKLEKETAEARANVVAAVEALEAAHGRLGAVLSTRIWLAKFPEVNGWKPAAEMARVPGLPGPNGSEYNPAVVLAALRRFGQPQPEPEPKANVQPLRPAFGVGTSVVLPAS